MAEAPLRDSGVSPAGNVCVAERTITVTHIRRREALLLWLGILPASCQLPTATPQRRQGALRHPDETAAAREERPVAVAPTDLANLPKRDV